LTGDFPLFFLPPEPPQGELTFLVCFSVQAISTPWYVVLRFPFPPVHSLFTHSPLAPAFPFPLSVSSFWPSGQCCPGPFKLPIHGGVQVVFPVFFLACIFFLPEKFADVFFYGMFPDFRSSQTSRDFKSFSFPKNLPFTHPRGSGLSDPIHPLVRRSCLNPLFFLVSEVTTVFFFPTFFWRFFFLLFTTPSWVGFSLGLRLP